MVSSGDTEIVACFDYEESCSRVIASDDRSHDVDDLGGRVAADRMNANGLKTSDAARLGFGPEDTRRARLMRHVRFRGLGCMEDLSGRSFAGCETQCWS
jgi:hypothetical protein